MTSFCTELCGHLADRHGTHKALLATQLAQALLHAAVQCQEADNMRQALRLFAAASKPLEIANKVAVTPQSLHASTLYPGRAVQVPDSQWR